MVNDESWVYVTDCMQDKIKPVETSFELSEKFSRLKELRNFQFNFEVESNNKAFSFIKKLYSFF